MKIALIVTPVLAIVITTYVACGKGEGNSTTDTRDGKVSNPAKSEAEMAPPPPEVNKLIGTLHFEDEEIPITVFYSDHPAWPGNGKLDSLIFTYKGIKQTVLPTGLDESFFFEPAYAPISANDYNNDGFMDISILGADGKDSMTYRYFLYDPQKQAYYYSDEL